mgnify:CR=1 FL=1
MGKQTFKDRLTIMLRQLEEMIDQHLSKLETREKILLITLGPIVLLVGLNYLLIQPEKRKVNEKKETLIKLEQRINRVNKELSAFSNIVSTKMTEKVKELDSLYHSLDKEDSRPVQFVINKIDLHNLKLIDLKYSDIKKIDQTSYKKINVTMGVFGDYFQLLDDSFFFVLSLTVVYSSAILLIKVLSDQPI